jgi:capsular polysaccharide transport system permease protein
MTDHARTLDQPFSLGRDSSRAASERAGGLGRALGLRPFLTVFTLIAIVAGVYYAFIAAPLFVSETRFAIRDKDRPSASSAGASALAGLTGRAGGLSEITAVSDYIRSPDMLRILEQRHGLRAHYAADRPDMFRRLSPDASDEDFLKFYRKMVIVRLNREADIIGVEVRAFDPPTAQAMARTILEQSEVFIDGLSSRLRQETVRSAEEELRLAEQQVQQARGAVASFRSVTDDVNPAATGQSAVGGVAQLEAQAGAVRAELNALGTYARPNAPQVVQAQARLATLNAQIAALQARQGGSGGAGGGGNLSQRVTQYEALIAQRDFAEKKLGSVQTAYDQARTSAEQREKYVVRIVQPNMPQEATEPNRLTDWLIVLIFAGTAYAIITLIVAGIRDHQGV